MSVMKSRRLIEQSFSPAATTYHIVDANRLCCAAQQSVSADVGSGAKAPF
jgi:hypothetical protein